MSFSRQGPWYVIDTFNCGLRTTPSRDIINLTNNTTGEIRVVRTGFWGSFNGNDADYQGRPGSLTEDTGVSPKILHCDIPGLTGAYWTAQDQPPSPLNEEV